MLTSAQALATIGAKAGGAVGIVVTSARAVTQQGVAGESAVTEAKRTCDRGLG
jgi:hypothetical protein